MKWQWNYRYRPLWFDAVLESLSFARRTLKPLVLGGAAFALGVHLTTPPEGRQSRAELETRLQHVERQLVARQGELELARIELSRMEGVHEHSARHRIPADLAASIYDIAQAEGIDPRLAYNLVRVESGFSPRAVSSAGAVGLTQLMPTTAFWLEPTLGYGDLFDREINLRLGFRYLRMLVAHYDGDLPLALLAYNRGPARVDSIRRERRDPDNGYARAVLSRP
jgi:soluble lytic murein transglycosylase-like protein